MGDTEVLLKLIMGVVFLAGNVLSALVLSAFKSYLNTKEAEKKLLIQRENHQNERLGAIESVLNERGIFPGHHRKN